MNSRAQAGLEYLVTYGWALVLVAAVIGALVFIVGQPAQEISANSSNSGKIAVKGVSQNGASMSIALQNMTGGKIELLEIGESGNYVAGSCDIAEGTEINAGASMLLECTLADAGKSADGTLAISFRDPSGIVQSVNISTTGGTITPPAICGNSIVEGAEVCDPPGGDIDMNPKIGCNNGCSGYEIKDCGVGLTKPGSYEINQEIISPANCITVFADNVTIDCKNNRIMNMSGIGRGILSQNRQNTAVKNCIIQGFQWGIYMNTVNGASIENVSSMSNSFSGIHFLNCPSASINNSSACYNDTGPDLSCTSTPLTGTNNTAHDFVPSNCGNVSGVVTQDCP